MKPSEVRAELVALREQLRAQATSVREDNTVDSPWARGRASGLASASVLVSALLDRIGSDEELGGSESR